MGLIDGVILGVIILLTIVYMTYGIIGIFGTIRYGFLIVAGLLVFDIISALLLVWISIFLPLLALPAFIHFSIFVAPLNLTVLIGAILRHYLERMCHESHCYYPEIVGEFQGRVERAYKKMECRKVVSDGEYLPQTIDRISTKPYCKYLGISVPSKKEK